MVLGDRRVAGGTQHASVEGRRRSRRRVPQGQDGADELAVRQGRLSPGRVKNPGAGQNELENYRTLQ